MIGLPDRTCCVTEMIRAPEQAGFHRRYLPFAISGVTFKSWIGGFMNYGNDPFVLHPDEIRPHQIVVRQVHDSIAGKCTRWQRKNENRTTQDRQFHPPKKWLCRYRAMTAHVQEEFSVVQRPEVARQCANVAMTAVPGLRSGISGGLLCP